MQALWPTGYLHHVGSSCSALSSVPSSWLSSCALTDWYWFWDLMTPVAMVLLIKCESYYPGFGRGGGGAMSPTTDCDQQLGKEQLWNHSGLKLFGLISATNLKSNSRSLLCLWGVHAFVCGCMCARAHPSCLSFPALISTQHTHTYKHTGIVLRQKAGLPVVSWIDLPVADTLSEPRITNKEFQSWKTP